MQSQIINADTGFHQLRKGGSECKNIYAAFLRTVFDFLLDLFILWN